jgi:hypothetical protein
MNGTVVYVHGDGNKPPSEDLRRAWDNALFGMEAGEHSRMAYWASLLHASPSEASPDMEGGELPRPVPGREAGPPPEVEPIDDFVADTLADVANGDGPLPADMRRLMDQLARRADALAIGDAEQAVGLEVLPLWRSARIKAFREFVKRTFKDVYAYAFGGSKPQMQDVLHRALDGAASPVVIVGHSLGSMICYDVLHDPRHQRLEVVLFATVGSPLGATEVQDVIRRPLEVPPPVRSWRNAADGRDLVALDQTIVPEYRPADRCTDYLVTNDSGNHHSIEPYLRARPIQDPIRDLMGVPRRG